MSLERELDWDDSIENDGSGFTLLMEGDYPFVVQKFDRGRHNGSAKLPPCNTISFCTPKRKAYYVHSSRRLAHGNMANSWQ